MVPPFLRGNIDGVHQLVSVWLRNLEEVEETVEKWSAGLNSDGFWWVPAPELNSVGGLIKHIGGASYRLLLRATGQTIPEAMRLKPAEEMQPDGRSPQEVLGEFKAQMLLIKDGLAQLGEDDFARAVAFGQLPAVPAIYVLDHICTHAQHHAGQVITTRKLWNAQNPTS